jgi:hypothetical protein
MGVRIQHEVAHARRKPRVDRLLQTEVVERGAYRLRANDGDRLHLAGRQDGRRFTIRDDFVLD